MNGKNGRSRPDDDVMVVDSRQQYVGHVHWAVARKALREKRARMWKRSPPAIMLPVGESSLPSFAERKVMETNTNYPDLNQMRGPSVMNWLKFFQEERDIWVQNISATQLSMQFDIAPGQPAGVLIPIGSHPVCLTQEVPFDAIKKSMDFRKFLNKVPSVMRLMTEEQVNQYYADYAKQLGAYATDPMTGKPVPNVAAAIQAATQERLALTTRQTTDDTVINPATGQVQFTPPKSAQELMNIAGDPHMGVTPQAAQAAGLTHIPQGFANAPAGFIQQAQLQAAGSAGPFQGPGPMSSGFAPSVGAGTEAGGFSNVGQGQIMMDQVIHPRVLNLCQQVSPQLPANMRMPADAFWRELKQLAPSLKFDDLQYIEAHGTYKTVKKWARELQADRVQQQVGDGIEDGLDQSPPLHVI